MSEKLNILFPDNLHFHERGFKSLFEFIKKYGIAHTFVKDRYELKACYGEYSEYASLLKTEYDALAILNKEQLFA